tara:strand:- start:169 stop:819 length:651 start_codon:yes stop_codon:yes gene_type:complete
MKGKNNNKIDIYIDFKSPYAYLAVEPSRALATKYKLKINWFPYILDIPKYLGSAKVDSNKNIIEDNRNDHHWRRVKYSYMDCRRYANTRNLTILGTQKIWDTSLISLLMLWIKNNCAKKIDDFINLTYKNFWKRELDIENEIIVLNILDELEINDNDFLIWKNKKGQKELDILMIDAHEKGVFGVPSYIYNQELFWGREQLPMIEARITDDYTNVR